MSFINYAGREINIKVLYTGARGAGVGTTVRGLHSKTQPGLRGQLFSLATDPSPTLFFDFALPETIRLREFKFRAHVHSVPTGREYEASRRLIIKGVDGVVFVADSRTSRREENLAAWAQLMSFLKACGYSAKDIPIALQFNRRDFKPRVVRMKTEAKRFRAGERVLPHFGTVAKDYERIFDPLKAVIKGIVDLHRIQLTR